MTIPNTTKVPSDEFIGAAIAVFYKPYLTTPEAAQFLGTSAQVLKTSRTTKELFGRDAPEYIKIGTAKVSYSRQTLVDWVESAPKMKVVGGAK